MTKLSAYHTNIRSAVSGLNGLYYDIRNAHTKAENLILEIKSAQPRLLRLWFNKVVADNDPNVLNFGEYDLIHKIEKQDICQKQKMLWEHWGNIREEAQHRHSLPDPGADACASDILDWCSNLRHILSDVSRFEGMAARVSGRIKLKKLTKDMDDCGGISYLEGLWRAKSSNHTFDIVEWSKNCSDIESLIQSSAISKEKKELQLSFKHIRKLETRLKELETIKNQLDFFISLTRGLTSCKHDVDNDHILWFLEEVRTWTFNIHDYCNNMQIKKPDGKKIKTAYSRLDA